MSDQEPDPRPGLYYVTAVDGDRHTVLLGPYSGHQTALDWVDAARGKARDLDPRAAFAGFGTARLPTDYEDAPRGRLHEYMPEAPAPDALSEEPAEDEGTRP